MTVSASSRATGKGSAAAGHMTIVGTATVIGIITVTVITTVMIMTVVIMTVVIMTVVIMTVTTADLALLVS
jgi:hypothetical protein